MCAFSNRYAHPLYTSSRAIPLSLSLPETALCYHHGNSRLRGFSLHRLFNCYLYFAPTLCPSVCLSVCLYYSVLFPPCCGVSCALFHSQCGFLTIQHTHARAHTSPLRREGAVFHSQSHTSTASSPGSPSTVVVWRPNSSCPAWLCHCGSWACSLWLKLRPLAKVSVTSRCWFWQHWAGGIL